MKITITNDEGVVFAMHALTTPGAVALLHHITRTDVPLRVPKTLVFVDVDVDTVTELMDDIHTACANAQREGA